MADETEVTQTETDETPGPGGASEIEAASARYLASLTPEQRTTPFPDDVNAGDATVAIEEDDEPEDVPVQLPEGFTVDAAGRAHRPDGSFAAKDEIPEGWTPPAKATTVHEDAKPELETEPAPEKEVEAAPATTVVLKGLSERGEEDLEIEVTDPEVAERLKRELNGVMRRREYESAMSEVKAGRAELSKIEAMLDTEEGAVHFTLALMEKDRQLAVARALLVEHIDTLAPEIEALLSDPVAVRDKRIELRDQRDASRDSVNSQIEQREYAASCMAAAQLLAPEDADPADVADFLEIAERDLIKAVESGVMVTPETVPHIVAKRVRQFGFVKAAEPPKQASANASTARPVSDRAKELADRKLAQAQATQQRVQRVQARRKNGSAVAPAGMGAAAVRRPVVPKGATIEEASKAVRHMTSWADLSTR